LAHRAAVWFAEHLDGAPPWLLRAAPAVGAVVALLGGAASSLATTPAMLRQIALVKPPYYVALNAQVAGMVPEVERLLDQGGTISVTWAGIVPYFTGRKTFDQLGKIDPRIAREPMHPLVPVTGFYQGGHMKWDAHLSFDVDQPDLIAQVWRPTRELVQHLEQGYVRDRRTGFFLRKGSAHVRWNEVEPATAQPGGSR